MGCRFAVCRSRARRASLCGAQHFDRQVLSLTTVDFFLLFLSLGQNCPIACLSPDFAPRVGIVFFISPHLGGFPLCFHSVWFVMGQVLCGDGRRGLDVPELEVCSIP
jgi:hypothetical protein